MVDLNKYSPALFERSIVQAPSTAQEAVGATIGLRVMPIIEGITQDFTHGNRIKDGYVAKDNLGTYTDYSSTLLHATSPEHMAAMKGSIDRNIQRRQVLENSSMLTSLGAGLLDPINAVALPLGGPAVGFGKSLLRVGLGSMAVEAGARAAVAPFDATQTAEDNAYSIAAAGIFGAGLGGLVSIPVSRQAAALTATNIANKEMLNAVSRIDNLSGMTPEQIASSPARTDRLYGTVDDTTLNSNITNLQTEADQIEVDNPQRATELRSQVQGLKNELGLRQVEDLGVDLKDPYNLKKSWFTDSVFYKAVSTPMKRTLMGKYPSAVKEVFVKSFGDSGVTLALNSVGIPSPQSIFQRTAVSAGRWVSAHDELIKFWADETGASTTSRLDLNTTDLSRRASRSNNTYREWLTTLSEKRIKGDTNLSENELKALGTINKYFSDAEARLEESGLIGTQKGMSKQIKMLDNEIAQLQKEVTKLKSFDSDMVDARIDKLTARRKSIVDAMADLNTPLDKEPFFPRFFDKKAIKNNRQQFSAVLYKWFEENPYVYKEVDGKSVRTELSRNSNAIQKRVDQTINNILEEVDPTSLDTVSFGMGRSKHFRHRQLDIPNKLVSDFMMKDPLAVMKAYSARIEPRHEFAMQFGKDLDGVLFDMERAMTKAGNNQEQINKVMRDYRHMYGRVIGKTLENPDTWDQKVAFFLREAASFSYMGASGLSAIPDFGRIVMEYDLENVVRGIQGIMDRESVSMTVDEIRIAGQAIDILKGSAHMRLVEDMSNNIDTNDLLNSARSAFYIVNGLSPLTTIAKQLAGIIDAHTIIERSIKLGNGTLDAQGIEWLARYGIGPDDAAKIARAPWSKTKDGLHIANTEQWADHILIPEVEGKTINVIEINDDGTPVGKMRNGRYIPAFYNDTDKTIKFDREYIEGPMFESKAWLNPRVEGVNAMPDIFKTPKQWSNFVMLHEIMHTRFSAKDLGFVKGQSEEIVINNAPAGMSRQEIIDNLESGVDNPDLVFHVTNQPQSIINDGFLSGGTVRGAAILDSGYGDYITVFDIRNIVEKIKSNQEILDKFQITKDQVDRFLAEKMYGESAFLSKYSADGGDLKDFNLLEGQKPVAAIHISELPQFRSRRFEGDRASEFGDAMGMSEAEDAMMQDYRSGALNKDSYDDYNTPPSYWGLSWDELSEEFDKIIESENTLADIGKNYNPFEEKVSRPSTVVDKASYENRINQMALEEYKAQQTIGNDTVQKFRVALNSGVLNTIMEGTPADKPIITDGVAYIPMSVASKFGMKEHPTYKGYARIENGLLGLPFQFYSYTLANVNKTVGAMAQGQVKNRAIGVATMMGLAYMSISLKTPDRIWKDMSWQDKFARSFDQSGVMALYSDMFYTSMHTSLALGGPNITGGLLNPKFKQGKSVADAVTGLAGAGPSWAYDTAAGIVDFAQGNYGEGAKQVVRNLPAARLWFLRDEVNQITNAWAN